jgi:HEAT repeat protein
MLSFLCKLLRISGGEDVPIHPELHRMLNPNAPLETLDSVIAKLESDRLADRRNAAYSLGDFDAPIVTERLLILLNDSDLLVKTYAIQSLGRRMATAAVVPLCELLLKKDLHPQVASNALRVLADLRDPRALDTLIALLKSKDPFLRYDAAFALGEIGDREAIPHLELLLSDDTIPECFDDDGGTTTAWSVGKNAKKAISKIRASKPGSRN